MNFKKVMAGVMAGSMVAAMAVVPAVAADEYHAYIVIQTGDWTFRDTYDNANTGFGTEAFNQVSQSVDNVVGPVAGTLTDATITGDGTYTVSVSGLEFTEDTNKDSNGTYRILGVSTDIPWDMYNEGVTFKIDSVNIGGKEVDFEEYDEETDYIYNSVQNQWNNDTANLGAHDATSSDISITFTVSGLPEASETGDKAPVAYLAAVVALAGVALVASKKARA